MLKKKRMDRFSIAVWFTGSLLFCSQDPCCR